MNSSPPAYFRHRFPAEIISHCVWLYLRFALSYRDIEEMMAKRGVVLTYETIREWCLKFGGTYAKTRPGWILVSTPPYAALDTIDCVPALFAFICASLNTYSELP
jgi:hypothetical protein